MTTIKPLTDVEWLRVFANSVESGEQWEAEPAASRLREIAGRMEELEAENKSLKTFDELAFHPPTR